MAPDLDAENVLDAFAINADGADHMMIAEALAVDVDHQQISLVPPAFPQLPQLFRAAFDRLAADAAARDPDGLAISGRTSSYWRVETPRSSAPIMRSAVAPFSCRAS